MTDANRSAMSLPIRITARDIYDSYYNRHKRLLPQQRFRGSFYGVAIVLLLHSIVSGVMLLGYAYSNGAIGEDQLSKAFSFSSRVSFGIVMTISVYMLITLIKNRGNVKHNRKILLEHLGYQMQYSGFLSSKGVEYVCTATEYKDIAVFPKGLTSASYAVAIAVASSFLTTKLAKVSLSTFNLTIYGASLTLVLVATFLAFYLAVECENILVLRNFHSDLAYVSAIVAMRSPDNLIVNTSQFIDIDSDSEEKNGDSKDAKTVPNTPEGQVSMAG